MGIFFQYDNAFTIMNGVNNLLLVINASVNFIIYIMISGPGKGIKVQSVPLGKKLKIGWKIS